MTYLTSLRLNERNRQAARDLTNCHDMHRTVMSMISDPRAESGDQVRRSTQTLYRISQYGGAPELLIQSANLPNPSTLPDGYHSQHRILDLDLVLTRITARCQIRYSLLAAPVRSIRDPLTPGIRGKKHPLTSVEQVAGWWLARVPSLGLAAGTPEPDATPGLAVDRAPFSGGRKVHAPTGRSQRIQHRAFKITGSASVTDPTVLHQALLDGIGPGKAYGLGLLTVIPT